MSRIIAAAFAAALAASPVFAQTAPRPAADQGALDAQAVARVEQALNGMRTMTSRFVQVSSNGGTAEGTIWMERPGNLRIDYAPPTKMELIVQGNYLVQVDKKLGTLTHIPLSRTPAGILVKGDVTLGGDLKVTDVSRGNGLIRIGVVQRGKEDEGQITLVFSDNPVTLRQWTVTDAQGIQTKVTLLDPQVNVALDPKAFDFDASKYERTRLD